MARQAQGIIPRQSATSMPRKNLVLPQGKLEETRAFSSPQDQAAALMFEPCRNRGSKLSASRGTGFGANMTGPDPRAKLRSRVKQLNGRAYFTVTQPDGRVMRRK